MYFTYKHIVIVHVDIPSTSCIMYWSCYCTLFLQNDSLFDNLDYNESCYYRRKLKPLMLDMLTCPIKFLEKQLKEVFNSH